MAQPQPWSAEELERKIAGFLEGGIPARLATMAQLVAHRQEATLAAVSRIHGNHHEYMLEIERLLEQLVDERWKKREDAERALIETGANARALIEQHQSTGKTLEERSRCQRILDRLAARGTEKEDRDIKMLRGLVATAPLLGSDDTMRAALRAATGHTDPLVVECALRSLGAIGTDRDADFLRKEVETGGPERRATALAALGRMSAGNVVAHCEALLAAGKLKPVEIVAMLRDLQRREDAKALIAGLASHADPLVAAAAKATAPPPNAPPLEVKLLLSDNSLLSARMLEVRGDSLVLQRPVEGLETVELPLREVSSIALQSAGKPTKARAFLKRGSLVVGEVRSMDEQLVEFQSPIFGKIGIARGALQGIAFDPTLDRLLGGTEGADKVRLREGGGVEGKVIAMNGGKLQIAPAGGARQELAEASVAGIVFARPAGAAGETGRYARVELQSGDRLLGHVAMLTPSHIVLIAPELGTAALALRECAKIEFDAAGGAVWGFTLIADYSENRVFEVDETGQEVFKLENVLGAWDAQCLENGNLLVTEFSAGQVREVTRSGDVVWSYAALKNPYSAQRLPNGNTLIADTFANRVIEVDKGGAVVWKYEGGIKPAHCERLPNGNTLIADMLRDRVLEVTPGKDICWEVRNMLGVYDAERLANGNTLVTLRTLNKVIEIEKDGKPVWQLTNLSSPSDADRLPNGNTLIAENGMVREFDRNGKVVWSKACTWAVEANRY